MKAMKSEPDASGKFGEFGGRYAPEQQIAALDELTEAMDSVVKTPEFQNELDGLLASYAGRPTPLTFAARMTEELTSSGLR